jgi:hydrophobe/amphiphile efflux-3 (HAE3) family protein
VRDRFARIAGWCVERPIPVLAGVVALALIAAVAALRLQPDAGTDQLVDNDSSAYRATQDFKQKFGDDAIVVLVKGDLQQLVLAPDDLSKLLSLEGCLSGNVPGGKVFTDAPAPAPCAAIAAQSPVHALLGGATFLNQSAIQATKVLKQEVKAMQAQARQAALAAVHRAQRQGLDSTAQAAAARAAATEVEQNFEQQLLSLGVKYGQTGVPRIDDPRFVSAVVFDSSRPGQPKPRFSIFWPSSKSAQILIRLKPDLSEAQRRDAIESIRAAVADPAFSIRNASYVVSGVPVVVQGLSDELSGEIFVLLAAALIVMTLTLALIFAPPLRLLPLAIALVAAALTFGLLALLGGSLTMASLAVLPILIGLSVDYAIQFQARFNEARDSGRSPPAAAVEAALKGAPVIGTAALATAAGFLVLLLSPIPMIRGFGLLLVAGIAIAFALALTAGLATLSLVKAGGGRRGRGGGRIRRGPALSERIGTASGFARIGTARAAVGTRVRGIGRRALAVSVAAPGRVLIAGALIAVLGWGLGTRATVISDIRELVPRNLPELQNVDELQNATGVSGEVEVSVHADDLTDPAVVSWMSDFKQRVLASAGYTDTASLCVDQDSQLCPFISLPDLFGDSLPQTAAHVQSTLALLPPYFLAAFINRDAPDSNAGTAVIPFGIKVMPFDEQKQLIDSIRSEIDPAGTAHDPPAGVTANVVGLPVLAADANSALSSNRYLLAVAGLIAVALVLLAVYRSVRRALVPLIPIVLATGWAALGLAIAGVPLNPMSATLGALVIAIATEFSVLLSARYEEERAPGVPVGEALRRAYSRTGMAVLASGITAIAGFAALMATDIRMLRDFGIVTVVDLAVALAGVLLVLPAALVWADRRFAAKTTPDPTTVNTSPEILASGSGLGGSPAVEGRQVVGS